LIKEKWIKRWLVILAGMIAPYFYLVGWQYSHTFYSEFGVDQAISSASFHEYIALGVQKTGEFILLGFLWLMDRSWQFYVITLVFLVVFITFYIFFDNAVRSSKEKDHKNKIRLWLRRNLKNKKFEYTVLPMLTAGILTTTFAVIVYIALVASTISLVGYRFAKYSVDTKKASYTACKPEIPNAKHDCTFVYDGSELVLSGMIVGRSSSRISIYNGQTETIELNGHRIVHQFKEDLKE